MLSVKSLKSATRLTTQTSAAKKRPGKKSQQSEKEYVDIKRCRVTRRSRMMLKTRTLRTVEYPHTMKTGFSLSIAVGRLIA